MNNESLGTDKVGELKQVATHKSSPTTLPQSGQPSEMPKGKIVHFVINEAEDAKVKALMPILKTKARTKVYKKAMSMAYEQFKAAGQIKG
jgi:hypothetical protein